MDAKGWIIILLIGLLILGGIVFFMVASDRAEAAHTEAIMEMQHDQMLQQRLEFEQQQEMLRRELEAQKKGGRRGEAIRR